MGSATRTLGVILLVALLLVSTVQGLEATPWKEGPTNPGTTVIAHVADPQFLASPPLPIPVEGAQAGGAADAPGLPSPTIVPSPAPPPATPTAGTLYRSDGSHRAPSKILLVDDDASDGTNTTSEFNNSGPYSMDTAHIMSETLDAISLDHDVYLVMNGSEGPSFETLSNYSTVVWVTGFEFGASPTLTRSDQRRLGSFMDAGGSLFLVGFGIFLDLYGRQNRTKTVNPLPAYSLARAHLGIEEIYHYTDIPDPVNTTANAVMTGSESYGTRAFFEQYGDVSAATCAILRPVPGALTILNGDSVDAWGNAHDDESRAVAYDRGVSRAATFGLDLACIDTATDRQDLVSKVMKWLGTPTLSLPGHSVMNHYIEVADHHPVWTDAFNTGFWTNDWGTDEPIQIFQPIAATLRVDDPVTVKAYVENHGDTDETSVDVHLTLTTITGNPALSVTKSASLDSRKAGVVTFSFTPTRSGMYTLDTEVFLFSDANSADNEASVDIRVCEWLDDMENGTGSWKAEGDWALDTDHYKTETTIWYWSKTGTTNASGQALYSPIVDLRYYNISYSHPLVPTYDMIWFDFFFTGRLRGTGQDYIDFQFKASNMSTWSSGSKIDGNTPGEDNVPGDFDDGWFHYQYGFQLGDYAGRTVQFRWVMVKWNPTSDSWIAVDDCILWMTDEANVPPEIVKKEPDLDEFESEVGTRIDLEIYAIDANGDALSYSWIENGVQRDGWTMNYTSIPIPHNSAEEKYKRGKTLEVSVIVEDGTDFNMTSWKIHLIDPPPIPNPDALSRINLNEDEPTVVDFSGWFYDREGQTWTIASEGSPNVTVTQAGGQSLTIENRFADWNGEENITLVVTDSAGSSASFTIPVEVLPVNDAPLWMDAHLPDAEQDTFYSYNLSVMDVDDDLANLTLSDDCPFFDITASGQIAFVPLNEHVGYNNFNVTVSDPDGAKDVMELELFVANVNDPPKLNYIPPQDARVGERFILDASAYVEDPDLLLPPEFRDRITYRDDTTKVDTNVETGELIWTPSEDDAGELFFTITVTDSKGRSDQQEIKITIVADNRPPRIGEIGRQTLVQGRIYTFTIPWSDPDHEYGDVVTFSNDHTELFVIDEGNGRINFVPENEHVGTWEVTITATDSGGLFHSKVVVFEVENENDQPRIEYIPNQVLKVGVRWTYQIIVKDPDMEHRLVDGLPVDPDESLSFRSDSAVVQVDLATGLLRCTPTPEDLAGGDIVVTITAVDTSSESTYIGVLFTFTGDNLPPEGVIILGVSDGDTVFTQEVYELGAIAMDPDDEPEDLVYAWFANGEPIGDTEIIRWTPYRATATVLRVVVSDPLGATAEGSINVRVASINVPTPKIDPDLDGSTVTGDVLEVDLDFPEGSIKGPLDVIVVSDVSGEVLTTTVEGDTTLVLDGLEPGEHEISITLSDGEDESVVSFVVTVVDDMHVAEGSAAFLGMVVLLAVVGAAYVERKGWLKLE
jgi:hypothetical protein